MPEITVRNKTYLIPDSSSHKEQWKIYLDTLRKVTGFANAKQIWLVTWQANGNTLLTTDAEFNQWAKRHDIDVSNAATRAVADISKMGGNLLGLGKNITKMIQVGIPVTAGIILLLVVLFAAKTVKNTDIKDVVQMTPVGKGLQLQKAIAG